MMEIDPSELFICLPGEVEKFLTELSFNDCTLFWSLSSVERFLNKFGSDLLLTTGVGADSRGFDWCNIVGVRRI